MNNIEKAKEGLLILKDNDASVFYPWFIINILENNYEAAIEYYNRLMLTKSARYDHQKDLAKRILNMIKTNKFDEKLYHETHYLGIKELCLRIKNQE